MRFFFLFLPVDKEQNVQLGCVVLRPGPPLVDHEYVLRHFHLRYHLRNQPERQGKRARFAQPRGQENEIAKETNENIKNSQYGKVAFLTTKN